MYIWEIHDGGAVERRHVLRPSNSGIVHRLWQASAKLRRTSNETLLDDRHILTAIHLSPARAAFAHHGWGWTTENNIELVGIIKEASLGMPHGILKVDTEGDVWTVEVGQPWRNEQAGRMIAFVGVD